MIETHKFWFTIIANTLQISFDGDDAVEGDTTAGAVFQLALANLCNNGLKRDYCWLSNEIIHS